MVERRRDGGEETDGGKEKGTTRVAELEVPHHVAKQKPVTRDEAFDPLSPRPMLGSNAYKEYPNH